MINLSIAICTYNRANILFEALKNLYEQRASKNEYEVIVIDNASTDNTEEVTGYYCNYLNVVYAYEPRQGLSYARNCAIDIAHSDYIAYVDDDIRLTPDWISTIFFIIKEISPDIFGGPIYPRYIVNRPIWFLDKYETANWGYQGRYLDNNEYLYGGNIIFKKDLLNKVGRFNPFFGMKSANLGYGEETEFIKRARDSVPSLKIYYEPKLITYHLIRPEKMRLSWFIKSSFYSLKFSGYINGYGRLGKRVFFYLILKVFYQMVAILLKITVGISFRNRHKYRYYQNYFIERIMFNFDQLFICWHRLFIKIKS